MSAQPTASVSKKLRGRPWRIRLHWLGHTMDARVDSENRWEITPPADWPTWMAETLNRDVALLVSVQDTLHRGYVPASGAGYWACRAVEAFPGSELVDRIESKPGVVY